MMAAGLIEEVRRVMDRFGPDIRPLGALGYRHVREYLFGRSSLEDAITTAQRDTRHFARRQLTWFRGEPQVCWHADAGEVDVAAVRHFLCERGCT
jgi:tRNA dimethylallyltransferase